MYPEGRSSQPCTDSAQKRFGLAAHRLVLCIDDEESGLAIRKLLLQEAGYEVVACSEPKKALALFLELQVCLVLLDYMMPGLNGMDLARQMRSRKPHVPIVMLSGCIDVPRDVETVVDVFLLKGGESSVLLDDIQQLVGKDAA